MKKLNTILLVASSIILFGVAGDILLLSYIRNAIRSAVVTPQWMGAMVALFLIVIGLLTLLSLLALFLQFRHFKDESILRSAAFVLGFFSLFLIAVDAVMLQEIGNELSLPHGSPGEWGIVFTGHAVHGLFALLALLQGLLLRRKKWQPGEIPPVVKDESAFLTVHQVGIFSALLGFLCIIALKGLGVPAPYVDGLLVLSSVVTLLPYALSAAGWWYVRRKEKPAEWYDEKQFMDLSRGALVTLVISVLVMTALFLLTFFKAITAGGLIGFPIYLCSTLLVFSASTLVIAHNW